LGKPARYGYLDVDRFVNVGHVVAVSLAFAVLCAGTFRWDLAGGGYIPPAAAGLPVSQRIDRRQVLVPGSTTAAASCQDIGGVSGAGHAVTSTLL
jgi:hypothetical protein